MGGILGQRTDRSPRDHDSLPSHSWRLGNHQMAVGINDFPRISVFKAWNKSIWNKTFSEEQTPLPRQKCNGIGCLQCPLVNTSNTAIVNNLTVSSGTTLNCKSRNVIYLWLCQLCSQDNSYFGRAIKKSHLRINTHRECFCDKNGRFQPFRCTQEVFMVYHLPQTTLKSL